jgi:hypothetical protein
MAFLLIKFEKSREKNNPKKGGTCVPFLMQGRVKSGEEG